MNTKKLVLLDLFYACYFLLVVGAYYLEVFSLVQILVIAVITLYIRSGDLIKKEIQQSLDVQRLSKLEQRLRETEADTERLKGEIETVKTDLAEISSVNGRLS